MKQNIYTPIQQVRDAQPIRAICFHPSGEAYVVGTNSKALKICRYPDKQTIEDLKSDEGPVDGVICEPEISFTCLHIHRASVYCAAFNQPGNLLATGSNDQIVHIVKYNSELHAPEGSEYKLALHNGTVRDVCFLPTVGEHEDSCLLLSAGGRDHEINMTDCKVMKPRQIFSGHQSTVMSVHCCEESENMFASGGLDGAIKVWDIRCRNPVAEVGNQNKPLPKLTKDDDRGRDISMNSSDGCSAQQQQLESENQPPASQQRGLSHQQQQSTSAAASNPGTGQAIPVGAVRLDPTGRLLVSGHQDGSCMLYDIRAGCIIQSFKAHDDEIRTLNFSPKSYYLLTAGYDGKARLTDLQGQLTDPLPSVEVLKQDDKIVQTAWHPEDYNFVTTCADGSATLWTIPDFDEWRRESFLLDI